MTRFQTAREGVGAHACADGACDFEHVDPAGLDRGRWERPHQVTMCIPLGALSGRRDHLFTNSSSGKPRAEACLEQGQSTLEC